MAATTSLQLVSAAISCPVGNPASAPPRQSRGSRGQHGILTPDWRMSYRTGLVDRRDHLSLRSLMSGSAAGPDGNCLFRQESEARKSLRRPGEPVPRSRPKSPPCRLGSSGHSQTRNSGTQGRLVSHPKQGKPHGSPASLSAVWQTFHPASSSERRRCYTSRTPSVWSTPRSLPTPGAAGRLKGLSPLLGPLSISFVSVASTSILLCCVCPFIFFSFDQLSLVRMPADSLESAVIP